MAYPAQQGAITQQLLLQQQQFLLQAQAQMHWNANSTPINGNVNVAGSAYQSDYRHRHHHGSHNNSHASSSGLHQRSVQQQFQQFQLGSNSSQQRAFRHQPQPQPQSNNQHQSKSSHPRSKKRNRSPDQRTASKRTKSTKSTITSEHPNSKPTANAEQEEDTRRNNDLARTKNAFDLETLCKEQHSELSAMNLLTLMDRIWDLRSDGAMDQLKRCFELAVTNSRRRI